MNATVVITTRNRKEELRTAIQSALVQTARPKVLVIDDGSTDGTADLIAAEFPSVQLHRVEKSQGLIVQRTRAAELTDADILFSIDDDAAFSTPSIVEQTLLEFQHPRVGAVAIPFINVNKEKVLFQRAPSHAGIYATDQYIGTAHAVRRKLFQRVGGYRAYLFHQGEEPDYCIRMLNAGFVVRLGLADPIHHFESPRRDFRRMDLFGRRNDILFAWYNAPLRYLPQHLLGTTINGLRFGLRVGRPVRMAHGLLNGYAAALHEFTRRKPVQPVIYRLSRMLKQSPMPLHEIEAMLPTIEKS